MGQVFRPGVNGLGANWDPSAWTMQAVFGSPIQGPHERNSQTRKKVLEASRVLLDLNSVIL